MRSCFPEEKLKLKSIREHSLIEERRVEIFANPPQSPSQPGRIENPQAEVFQFHQRIEKISGRKMTPVFFSSSFMRVFIKRIAGRKGLAAQFWQREGIFISDPFGPRLRTHQLSGKLNELWSFSSAYDLRVIFNFCRATAQCLKSSGDTTKFIES